MLDTTADRIAGTFSDIESLDVAAKRAKVSKASVHYRPGYTTRQCGDCAMFSNHECDLVAGTIDMRATCDEWIARRIEKAD